MSLDQTPTFPYNRAAAALYRIGDINHGVERLRQRTYRGRRSRPMLKNMPKLGAVLIAATLVTGAVAAQNAAFTFTTINVPGAIQTNANGINSRGQIVGFYTDASSGRQHGFLDDNGTLT